MLVGVVFACFLGVMDGVVQVALGDLRVMAGLFVVAGVVMVGGLTVMAGGVVMVFRSFAVMFGALRGHSWKTSVA